MLPAPVKTKVYGKFPRQNNLRGIAYQLRDFNRQGGPDKQANQLLKTESKTASNKLTTVDSEEREQLIQG